MNLKDTYNKIAEDWHSDHRTDDWWQEGTNAFISYLKKGDSVLDVGCGSGTKSKYLLSHGLQVTGIDFSENLLEIARQEAPEGTFLLMDVYDIDTIGKKFEGIFMQAVLLHIPKKDIESIIKKAVQKLKSGGYLYVEVKEKTEGKTDEEVKIENDYGYEFQRFFSYFTPDEVKQYFKNAGLEIVHEQLMPPSRATRKTNWIQLIGKK